MENQVLLGKLAEIEAKFKEIVCTEGVDAGVIYYSHESTTHYDAAAGGQVYDHHYFSPLGDALMALFGMIRDAQSEQRPAADAPLRAALEGDQIVIRLGIDTNAFATAHSPHFYDYEQHGANEGPYLKIDDKRAFANEVVRALRHEEEDGSGPLTKLFDEAAERALDDGAEGVDFEWTPEKK